MNINKHTIFNYREVNESVAISGQPNINLLPQLRSFGFEAIIQINVLEAPYNERDEAYHARMSGLQHSAMTISFNNPTLDDVANFFMLMERHTDKKTLVHCAAGHGTASMVMMYHMVRDGIDYDTAVDRYAVSNWSLNPRWRRLFEMVTQATSIKDFINRVADPAMAS